ncbi:MAG: carboxypeptidase-like regulatory domain-containing protein [Patescibacteria group bacterium]
MRSFSLLEIIIAIFIFTLVSIGILETLSLGIDSLTVSKLRAGALVIAQEEMEFARNLDYNSVGTQGGIPSGNLIAEEEISLNNINYTKKISIQYVDAPEDGLDELDENSITADYKQIRVEVSWQTKFNSDKIVLLSNYAPKGIETVLGGGTLKLTAFDSQGISIPQANVLIKNDTVIPQISINTFTNNNGLVTFPGSPTSAESYEITINKNNYSTSKTYARNSQNVTPMPSHLTIIESETTEASFTIDKVSQLTIKTYDNLGTTNWWNNNYNYRERILLTGDSNIDSGAEVKIPLSHFNLVQNEKALASGDDVRIVYGDPLILREIPRININNWNSSTTALQIAFQTQRDIPANNIDNDYWVYYGNPLASNPPIITSVGTIISGNKLSEEIYEQFLPISNINFNLRGNKIIGKDSNEKPIYKYNQNFATGSESSAGYVNIENIEWDIYDIVIDGNTEGYDIASSNPYKPINIPPNTNNEITFNIAPHTSNSLLLTLIDSLNNPIFGADVNLTRAGFNQTKETNVNGQVFFNNIYPSDDYTVNITLLEYSDSNYTNIEVSEQSNFTAIINKQ